MQVALVVGMVGLTYASVPLYRMFCQATGFGGTVKEGRSVEDKLRKREEEQDEQMEAAAAARELTVVFNADVADGMQWRFVPTQRSVKVRLSFNLISLAAWDFLGSCHFPLIQR